MLLNPPLQPPQLLEGLLACTPRRPIRRSRRRGRARRARAHQRGLGRLLAGRAMRFLGELAQANILKLYSIIISYYTCTRHICDKTCSYSNKDTTRIQQGTSFAKGTAWGMATSTGSKQIHPTKRETRRIRGGARSSVERASLPLPKQTSARPDRARRGVAAHPRQGRPPRCRSVPPPAGGSRGQMALR